MFGVGRARFRYLFGRRFGTSDSGFQITKVEYFGRCEWGGGIGGEMLAGVAGAARRMGPVNSMVRWRYGVGGRGWTRRARRVVQTILGECQLVDGSLGGRDVALCH